MSIKKCLDIHNHLLAHIDTTFDGGGMAMGIPLPSTCDTSSTGAAGASSLTSTASVVGPAAAGIPLGSVEIGNGGLSPLPVSPIPDPMPPVAGSGANPSMNAASSPPMISAPGKFTPAVGIGGPCTAIGASISPTGC